MKRILVAAIALDFATGPLHAADDVVSAVAGTIKEGRFGHNQMHSADRPPIRE